MEGLREDNDWVESPCQVMEGGNAKERLFTWYPNQKFGSAKKPERSVKYLLLQPKKVRRHGMKKEIQITLWKMDNIRKSELQSCWQTRCNWYTYLHEGRWRELSGVSIRKALILFIRALPHDIITSQSSHIQIPSHWGVGFNIRNLGGIQIFSL